MFKCFHSHLLNSNNVVGVVHFFNPFLTRNIFYVILNYLNIQIICFLIKLYSAYNKNAIIKFAVLLRKIAERIGNFAYRKGIFIMYRDRLDEIRKEKGYSNKRWAEESGVSIDTIGRIIHPENPDKDSPRVNTLEDLCKPLGVELWEIFYLGDHSLVALQAEILSLKAERDALIAENGALKEKVETLRDKVDDLKDEIIATHNYYIKSKSS